MGRKIIVFSVVAFSSVLAAGGTLAGGWEATVQLTPDPYLVRTKLGLNYLFNEWSFTSSSLVTAEDGYVEQGFFLYGALGPVSLSAGIVFYPQDWTYGPYGLSWLDASVVISGVNLTLSVDHFNYPYGFAEGEWPCETEEVYMVYSAALSMPPLSLLLELDDCCTGTAFKGLTLELSDIAICCGITFDAELSFLKAGGFDYLKIAFQDILQLCCGISLDFSVILKVDSKVIDIKPKLAGLGEGCVTLYGNVLYDQAGGLSIGGFEIYGWKLRCSFGDCTFAEFLHALNVAKIEEAEGDVFEGEEFEFLRVGFCGAGCCGGRYQFGATFYFDNLGGLFGIGRVVLEGKIPIMANFLAKVSLVNRVAGDTALQVGWVLSF